MSILSRLVALCNHQSPVHHRRRKAIAHYRGQRHHLPLEEDRDDAGKQDISLNIAGFELHFDHAHLERKGRLSDRRYQLVLTGEPVLDRKDARWLNQFHFVSISRPDGSSGTAYGGVRIQPIGRVLAGKLAL